MPVINGYDSWPLVTREDVMKKGKLVRIELSPGRFVKMHEKDAIAQGLLKPKAQPPAKNKMKPPQGDKVVAPPDPSEGGKEKEGDDFTTIDGVGPATARALQAHGIATFEQLRQAHEASALDFLSAQARQAIERWRGADVTD
jgi:predicted flap endonuclease-1-like 5' DNA nuclease